MKNPPAKEGEGSKALSECSSDSLAVFYVEQVALNRHVSSEGSIGILLTGVKEFSPAQGTAAPVPNGNWRRSAFPCECSNTYLAPGLSGVPEALNDFRNATICQRCEIGRAH